MLSKGQQPNQVKDALRKQGFCMVKGDELGLDPSVRTHEAEFASEWSNLGSDDYLKNSAKFRKRRYGRFCYIPSERSIRQLAHQPYYQSSSANYYAGGIHRVVAPLTDTSVKNPLLAELIRFDFDRFPVNAEVFHDTWEVACHQFQIISRPGELGEPTPEGIHRDEIDFGAIHLLSRSNVNGGQTQIYDLERTLVTDFLLESPMDSMFWNDRQILHAVKSFTPFDPKQLAIRDILALGYKRDPALRDAF
ncbi:2OG-Fe dioxygenase family protein [Plectonema radiosum NIES-515]|uniref:2OG-Fe dioxygenase family protein n=1 Tax=Plectonema radiosum NIES-515 TaxID=2986073 RepID=A0ABT3B3D6_9CYAN|nr:2OG-Fe dioxygenase family protein [Plectonema radiosum]MCV3215379.1 2OG-Fe dioxygenase family protein [Plectonema radiosum NIES-515]